MATNTRAEGRVAFTYPNFIYFQLGRAAVVLAQEMQSVAVGWQIYEITRRPLDLGLVGLAQFLPGILLVLVTGHVADRFDRRHLVMLTQVGFGTCSALFLEITLRGAHSVLPIYGVVVLLGVTRAFNGPVGQAFLPQLVEERHFPNAVAWGATFFQGAIILGPSVGGLVYAFRGPGAVYATAMAMAVGAVVSTSHIKPVNRPRPHEEMNLGTLLAGFRFIWRNKLILGLISLDLFAVLLGGAVALLPVYARDILRTGPWGLGLLRSAPGVGAGIMAVVVAHWPMGRRAGVTMLWCVAGFGVFTICFGLSRSLELSLTALLLVGATDMVSVIVRNTLVQLSTPDAMRGRVAAVYMLFTGASNELGQFESGVTAQWFGTVAAVVLGGAGTLVVIALWAWMFPELRRAQRPAMALE